MRRAVTAQLIHIKFCTLNPWLDGVQFGTGVWEGQGGKSSLFPLTLALVSNTAYCAIAHTRDWVQLNNR